MKKAAALLAILLLVLSAWAHWPDSPLSRNAKADAIVIEKGAGTLTLLQDGRILKIYRIALGRNPIGAKEREGDHKTPEGTYRITEHFPESAFHRALRLSYPEPRDVQRAQALGVSPGSDIMIHGIRNGFGWMGHLHRRLNWTQGCIAVTNPEIEEIWDAVPNGASVDIRE